MKRILIIGSGGAGKSTLAKRLGAILKLPVIHLDRLFWKPGWVGSPEPEWNAIVATEIARPEWIMDGNFGRTVKIRLEKCDTVIFLHLPRWLCLWRVLMRRIKHRTTSRPDMTEGCAEKLDLEFLKWIWTYPGKKAPGVLAMLNEVSATRKIGVLRSSAEVEAFLDNLGRTAV